MTIELQTAIGALIGIVSGATPFIVSYLWRECRERRIERARQAERELQDRQAERDHLERMQKLNNERATIQLGIERKYAVDIHKDSIAFLPPKTQDPDPPPDDPNP